LRELGDDRYAEVISDPVRMQDELASASGGAHSR
jgi:hypothetical protein